ncbi:hypothetical protein ABL78_7997 [Leptomonas seymouri]|uniref:Conserved oligomeric Golgi complex subunit 1 n=1 Tax=Leptomonas seymouri TaxID=5684 RepID=A0A0N1IHF5_LEPSE|nr:hypothetical protein ABL78_7997 [Leptomonas seymouri]|eukprot:KPI82984.1 hypothetical protein ABL78_7997 [Leptomonas seymouri]
MSVEEALHEVRRILRLNDVDEALHYLSTVTRSIEVSQHDLRAAIGSSYRDLLAACDGVVGMERDCQDVLAIEAALAKQSREHSATTPLLPPEWFARRQHRLRHTKATSEGEQGKPVRDSSPLAAPPSTASGRALAKERATPGLPKVALPLPPSATQSFATPPLNQGNGVRETAAHGGEGKEASTACALLEGRMRLDVELQSLHLQYLAAAAAVRSKGGVAADMRMVFSVLEDGGADASVTKSAETAQSKNAKAGRRGAAAAAASLSGSPESAAQSPRVFHFPLISFAERLQCAQSTLADFRKALSGSNRTEPVVSVARAFKENNVRHAGKTPAWILHFQRRATTLETRLMKLLLARLRRAADAYAQLFDLRARHEQLAKRLSASASPDTHSSAPSTPFTHHGRAAAADVVTTKGDTESVERRCRVLEAEERAYTVYLCAILAECHGVMRALRTSPTLLDAVVACAPAIELPHTAQPSRTTLHESHGGHVLDAVPAGGPASSLFRLASLKTREVVMNVLCDGGSPPLSRGQQREGQADAIRFADSSRWLLALISVLLLREAQVSAARWSVLSSTSAVAVEAHMTGGRAAAEDMGVAHSDAKKSGAAAPVCARCSSDTACTRAFVSADLLSSLGLCSGSGTSCGSSMAMGATPNAMRAAALCSGSLTRAAAAIPAHPAASQELSNTAWALRCFSGLSLLLRGAADYVDLLKLWAARHHEVQAACLSPEDAVLHTLRDAYKADTELQNRIRNIDERSSDAGTSVDDSDIGFQRVGGARSLKELLAWRLKGCCGRAPLAADSAADALGTPHTARKPFSSSPLQPACDSSTTPSGFLSPGTRESPEGTTPVMAEATPGRQRTAFGAELGGGAALSSAARCRAWVETLRASLTTVPELNSTGAARAAPLPLLGDGCAAGTLRRMPNGTSASASPIDAVLLSAASLDYIARELLAPLISSLVVSLARDPVAITIFGDYAAQQDTSAVPRGGPGEPSAPASSVSASMLSAVLLVGGGLEADVSRMEVMSVGVTWRSLCSQPWWEKTRLTALHAALQRCFTVALQSVSLVESCVVRGLINSTRSIAVSSEGQGHAEGSEGGGSCSHDGTAAGATAWSLDKLQHTWATLSDVLQRHTLPLGGSSGDASGAATADTQGTDPHGVETPQKRERGSAAVAAAAGNGTPDGASYFTKGDRGRVALVPRAAGIDWSRFRSPGAAAVASAAGGTLDEGRRYSPLRRALGSESFACCGTGDAMFHEEGLDCGLRALRAVPRLSPLTQHSESAVEEQGVTLSLADQQAVVTVLSGFGQHLFSSRPDAFDASPGGAALTRHPKDRDGGSTIGEVPLNRHAAALLHLCLQTLVAAVKAFGSAPVPADHPSTVTASLYTRVVLWLRDSLGRLEAQLNYLPRGEPHALPTPSEVIHSYEMSLVLRVYGDVLRQLAAATPRKGCSDAAEGEARQLCERTAELFHRANGLWQEVLLRYYRDALRCVYCAQSQVDEEGASGAVGNGKRMLRSSCRWAAPSDSWSWIRATTEMTTAAGAADSTDGGSHSSRGLAYPAAPTPALTEVLQRTLRLLHQALYGRLTVYGDSDRSFVGGGAASSYAESRGGTAAGGPNASGTALHKPFAGVAHQMVAPQERQHVVNRLAQESAALFEEELLPLLSASSSSATHTNHGVSGSPSSADDVRLQWLMDLLCISTVWCTAALPHGSSGGGSHVGADASCAVPDWSVCTPSGCADASRYVAPGPMQRTAALLEQFCDRIRWRSAVPLMIWAYRQFVASSAALWVTCKEEEGGEWGALDDANEAKGMWAEPVGVALDAVGRPFVGDRADGAVGGPAPPIECLLQPRERVDRLALLPIAVSRAAAAVNVSGGAGANTTGVSSMGPSDFAIAAPSAATLNPHPVPANGASTTSAWASAAGRMAAVGVQDYRAAGSVSMPSSIGPVGGSVLFHDTPVTGGALAAGGSAAVLGAAGAGATSAAAAASSLWGTTQRGWNHLWGSN